MAENNGGGGVVENNPPDPTKYGTVVAVDIETSGLTWDSEILVIAVAYHGADGSIISESINVGMDGLDGEPPVSPPEARLWVQASITGADWVVFHNGSFDIPFLIRDGFLDAADLHGCVFDTMFAARWTGAHSAVGLEPLCREYGIPVADDDFYTAMKAARDKLAEMPQQAVQKYAEMDTANTLRLAEILLPTAIDIYGDDFTRNEGDFVIVVSLMRVHGLALNYRHMQVLRDDKQARLEAINRQLLQQHGLKGATDSTGIRKLLVEQGLSGVLGRTPKGGVSVDEAALASLPGVADQVRANLPRPTDPEKVDEWETARKRAAANADSGFVQIVALLLEGRHLQKEISTWLDGFLAAQDDLHRVHPLWGAGGTVSNRLNCRHPGAQTVPKHLHLWAAAPGSVLIELDYKQAEPRFMAAYCKSTALATMFATGQDLYSQTAQAMKIERIDAKRVILGAAYGGGVNALMRAAGIMRNAAVSLIKRLDTTYPEIRKTSEQVAGVWVKRGYITLAGGKRLYGTADDLATRPYKAFNQLLQGSVAETIKEAMIRIWREFSVEGGGDGQVRIVGQIHDALLVEVPAEGWEGYAERIRVIMAEAAPPSVLALVTPALSLDADITLRGEPVDGAAAETAPVHMFAPGGVIERELQSSWINDSMQTLP